MKTIYIANGGYANTGVKHSEKTRMKMRGKRPHCSGENHHSYGKEMSQKTKDKISESKRIREVY